MVGRQRINAGLDMGEVAGQQFRHVAVKPLLAQHRRAVVARSWRFLPRRRFIRRPRGAVPRAASRCTA